MRSVKRAILLCLFFVFSIESQASAKMPSSLLQPARKSTICLNMIVKNEAHVIRRCIDSLLPIIDYWVIVDTGSTDGTQQIIIDYMKEKEVPGELYERPWVNFGHNREEALVLAKGKGDYIFFMDADDIIRYDEKFKLPALVQDCYLVPTKSGGTQFYIPRLIKSSLDWHWYGVLHEYVHAPNVKNGCFLKGIECVYICDGARSKDPNKLLKDIQLLTDAVEKEPENARNVFYLAQTYSSARKFHEALENYQKRVEMGGWEEECFCSLLQIAILQDFLDFGPEVVKKSFEKALKFRPTRPEPYFFLARLARSQLDYKRSYELTKTALEMSPCRDILFLEKSTYDGILFEYSISSWYMGHYQDSLKACDKLLAKKDLPQEYKEYTLTNRQFAIDKLKELNPAFQDPSPLSFPEDTQNATEFVPIMAQ